MRYMSRVLIGASVLLLFGCGNPDPSATGGPLAMRRLTGEQYRNAIEDTFGSQIEVAGRFEPDNRQEGLNALGASRVCSHAQWIRAVRSHGAQHCCSGHFS